MKGLMAKFVSGGLHAGDDPGLGIDDGAIPVENQQFVQNDSLLQG